MCFLLDCHFLLYGCSCLTLCNDRPYLLSLSLKMDDLENHKLKKNDRVGRDPVIYMSAQNSNFLYLSIHSKGTHKRVSPFCLLSKL